MPQSGKLVFFTTNPLSDPQGVLAALLQTCGATEFYDIERKENPDRTWKELQEILSGGDPDYEDDWEPLDTEVEPDEVPGYYIEGKLLSVELRDCDVSDKVADAIETRISKSVRGDFVPAGLTIRMGEHDLCENAEHDEGFYFGRATLSLSMFGYSSPNDWEQTRQLILALDEVQNLRRKFEAACGPLQTIVYWDA